MPLDRTTCAEGVCQGATRTTGPRPRAFLRRVVSRPAARRTAVVVVCLLVLPVVLAGVARGLVAQPFTVPSASMQPTLAPGEAIRVWRPDALFGTYERGDLVVFDGRGSFIGSLPPTMTEQVGAWFGLGPRDVYFVKRVVGVGGDTVQCCDESGQLMLDGEPLEEPYLLDAVGEPRADGQQARASGADFAVEVPEGRVWLMGDNRYDSHDSRDLLGRPGGGMVREQRIVGTVMGTR